mmetsp:Transcript_48026/g.125675  ORF Transcript_48026/g.125675 Transcript_48026/m.125675 type:complete len:83 (+) Transcript_48026:81-329(+)
MWRGAYRAMRFSRREMSSNIPSEGPLPLSERLLNFGHRVVASGLILISATGLAFVGNGCWEIYDRNMKRKKIKEQQQAQGSA